MLCRCLHLFARGLTDRDTERREHAPAKFQPAVNQLAKLMMNLFCDSRGPRHPGTLHVCVCRRMRLLAGEVGNADVGGSAQEASCTGQEFPCHQRHRELFGCISPWGLMKLAASPS